MDTYKKIPYKKLDDIPIVQKQSFSVPLPLDMERCRGCTYPGVGFICWSTDGSCMKTDVEKICGRPGR